MRVSILCIAVLILSGCSKPLYLRHDNKPLDSQEYFSDKTECKLYANSAAPIVYRSGFEPGRDGETWTMTYYECMRGKGWYAVDKSGNKIEYKWCDQIDCFQR